MKLDDIDRNWKCFPIHVVSVSFKFSSFTHDVKDGDVLKEFLVFSVRDTKGVKFVKQCFTEVIHVSGENMLNSFLASCQMSLQVSSCTNKLITRWPTISFKKSIDIVFIANVTFVT